MLFWRKTSHQRSCRKSAKWAGPANHSKREMTIAFGLRDHADFVTESDKLAGKKVRRGFDPARAGEKMVRPEQDSHGSEGNITRATRNRQTPGRKVATAFFRSAALEKRRVCDRSRETKIESDQHFARRGDARTGRWRRLQDRPARSPRQLAPGPWRGKARARASQDWAGYRRGSTSRVAVAEAIRVAPRH